MSKKNPSWGGRFSKKPSQIAQNFSSSVDVDQALYSQDIRGSIAYAEALMDAKVLSKNECNKIKTGLKKCKHEWIFQTDGDAEYDVNDLLKLIKKRTNQI